MAKNLNTTKTVCVSDRHTPAETFFFMGQTIVLEGDY